MEEGGVSFPKEFGKLRFVLLLLPTIAALSWGLDEDTSSSDNVLEAISKGNIPEELKAPPDPAVDSAYDRILSGESGLTTDRGRGRRVHISSFFTLPQGPIPAEKETAYKAVLEQARRFIASEYSHRVDTTQRRSYYRGDVTLEVLLDDTGGVSSCSVDDYSVREESIRELTRRVVSERNFKPAHSDTTVEGFVAVFSFVPLVSNE